MKLHFVGGGEKTEKIPILRTQNRANRQTSFHQTTSIDALDSNEDPQGSKRPGISRKTAWIQGPEFRTVHELTPDILEKGRGHKRSNLKIGDKLCIPILMRPS